MGGSVGYSAFDSRVEVEAYAAVRAIRYVSDDRSTHIPYGARVRVALNNSRTFYAEYEHEEVADFGNDKGLLDKSRIFSIVWRPN